MVVSFLSPGGEQLALTLEVFPDCTTLECTVELLEEHETSPASGHLYERLFARHWDSWMDGRRSHLFVMPSAGGEIRDLIPRLDADVPSKPFGGSEEMTFTADGQGIVFTMRDVGSAEPWSTDFDLYFVPVDGRRPQVPDRVQRKPGIRSRCFHPVARPWPIWPWLVQVSRPTAFASS